MGEKEKNPRLRRLEDLPPEAQAARRRQMEILKADGPQSEVGEPIPLAQAAARLGCARHDLLGAGIDGKHAIYAPVLDEGLYAWPVTDRGMRHSRVLGMAIPVFRRRLNVGDKGMLTVADIERIRQGAPVIPEGYIFPDITLRCIETWETDQSEGPASERMRDLAKEVAWVHPSRLDSERGRWPSPTRMLGIDMLLVDPEGVPVPTPLTISELASAFRQHLNNVHPSGKDKITDEDWERIFQKPRRAMLTAKVAETKQGKVGRWKPVEAGITLHEEYGYPWIGLNQAFRRHELLRLWWPDWASATKHRGNEKVDEPEGELSSASPFRG